MKIQMFGGIGVVALAIVGVAAFAQQGQAQAKKVDHMEHNAMMQSCAKACSDCQRACDACATHCTHMLHEGKKEHLATLTTCQDCATICSAAAQIAARGGPFSTIMCSACAETCSECGKMCEKFPDDKHMKACAEDCRKCEKACKAMVKHMTVAMKDAAVKKDTVASEETFTLSVPVVTTTLKQSGTQAIAIGIRRDTNFDQDVTLKFTDVPKGVTFEPTRPVIKHGDTETKFTLRCADDAALGNFAIQVTGFPTKGADASREMKLTVTKK
jgi:hypothetical protein